MGTGPAGVVPLMTIPSLPQSAQERQQQQRIRIEPARLTQGSRLLHVFRGTGSITAVQVNGREPVVAGHNELRLADLLGQCERLIIRALSFLELPRALMNLRHDNQGNGQMIELPELTIESGGLCCSVETLRLAFIRE